MSAESRCVHELTIVFPIFEFHNMVKSFRLFIFLLWCLTGTIPTPEPLQSILPGLKENSTSSMLFSNLHLSVLLEKFTLDRTLVVIIFNRRVSYYYIPNDRTKAKYGTKDHVTIITNLFADNVRKHLNDDKETDLFAGCSYHKNQSINPPYEVTGNRWSFYWYKANCWKEKGNGSGLLHLDGTLYVDCASTRRKISTFGIRLSFRSNGHYYYFILKCFLKRLWTVY